MKSKLLLIFSVLILVAGCRSDNDGDGKGDTLLSQEEWDQLEEVAADIWNDYQDSQKEADPVVTPTPTPTPTPVPEDAPDQISDKAGPFPPAGAKVSKVFLWKPIGDGGGPAVSLVSGEERGYAESAQLIQNGQVIETSSRHDTPAQREGVNGWRPHFYWNHQGSHYAAGGPVTVRTVRNDGKSVDYAVANPSARTEYTK